MPLYYKAEGTSIACEATPEEIKRILPQEYEMVAMPIHPTPELMLAGNAVLPATVNADNVYAAFVQKARERSNPPPLHWTNRQISFVDGEYVGYDEVGLEYCRNKNRDAVVADLAVYAAIYLDPAATKAKLEKMGV